MWKRNIIELFQDILRFAIYAALITNGILFSMFSVWFVYRFLGQLMAWCRRVMFSEPW